jgi:N6-L-threonylcarbamoyladenine synthase
MRILAIETSCDETAIAIVEAGLENTANPADIGCPQDTRFTVLGDALISQIDIHKEYGGVFPALAKREHAKNLVPLLDAALEEAELLVEDTQAMSEETRDKIAAILSREPGLTEAFFAFVGECEPPAIDVIAVTAGPGLEPALWVGVNFAKALALAWQKPLVAVNHMEGHIMAALAESHGDKLVIKDVAMPVLALLISGGHTELVLMREWLKYELVGQTRDDAVGEAFDKVARMLELPYPGGPEISRLAEESRSLGFVNPTSDVGFTKPNTFALPRPMINDATCDFSFSGLKTAVLTLVKNRPDMSAREKQYLAHEFEDAVAEVLMKKTLRALEDSGAATLVLGGGVSANTHIRRVFRHAIETERPDVSLRIPAASLTTDNAIMIALAGYYRALREHLADPATLAAQGNRSLSSDLT